MANLAGESPKVGFEGSLKLEFHGSKVTSSVYSRLAGYEDVNDAERLAVDPTMRAITGKLAKDKNSASANTMGRFETDILTLVFSAMLFSGII